METVQERLEDWKHERAVLGRWLIDRAAIPWKARAYIAEVSDWQDDRHLTIGHALHHLLRTNQPTDLLTLSDYLAKNTRLEAVGGWEYLVTLLHDVYDETVRSHPAWSGE